MRLFVIASKLGRVSQFGLQWLGVYQRCKVLGNLFALDVEYAQKVGRKQFLRKNLNVFHELRGGQLLFGLWHNGATGFPPFLLDLFENLKLSIVKLSGSP